MKTKTTIEIDLDKLGVEKTLVEENKKLQSQVRRLENQVGNLKVELARFNQLNKHLLAIESLANQMVDKLAEAELVDFQRGL